MTLNKIVLDKQEGRIYTLNIKVIKKVIKYLSEGILIEKLNKIKGGNLVHMMLKRNSIRFEFNWHDDIKR